MEVFNNNNHDDDDNNHNNNLPNKQFIKYYWLNFNQHWPLHSANQITGGLCAVHNVGSSHLPILPSPKGLPHRSKSVVLGEVQTDRTINSVYS